MSESQDFRSRPPGSEIRAPSASVLRERLGALTETLVPRLRGRAAELATLTRHVRAALAGRGHGVLVQGPAGIGKTTLLEAVRDGRACAVATVLHTTCENPATDYDAVRRLFASLDLTSDSSVLQGRARRAKHALSLGDKSASAGNVYSVADGLVRLADHVMAETPLVLIVDDVDQCDPKSLRWLDFLLRRSAGKPLLVLLARRTDESGTHGALLAEILDPSRYSTIDLGPLPHAAVSDVIARITGQWPTTAFSAACATVSGSNPLFLTRLLGELQTAGLRPVDEHAERVAEVGRDVAVANVLAKLAEQPEPVRRVAAVIAALGDTQAEVDLVAAIARVPIKLAATATDLLWTGQLAVWDETVRSALLAGLPAGEVAQLREAVARLLNDAGYPAETVAEQLIGLPSLLGRWMYSTLIEGAKAAADRGCPAIAATFLRRALESEPYDIEVRLQLAEALAETDPPAARAVLVDGIELAADDVSMTALISVKFAMTSLQVGRSTESIRVLSEALVALAKEFGAAPEQQDHELLVNLKASMIFVGLRDPATVASARTMAATVPAPAGDTTMERMLLAALALETATAGRSAQVAVEQARKALKIHAERGPEYGSMPAAMVLELAGDPLTALAVMDQTAAVCARRGAIWTHCTVLGWRAATLTGIGELAKAEESARAAIAIIDEQSWRDQIPGPRIVLASVLAARGDPSQAGTILDEIDTSQLHESIWDYHGFLMARASTKWGLGDRKAALTDLLRCGQSIDQAGFSNPALAPWWQQSALLLAEIGRGAEAVTFVERGEALTERWMTDYSVGQCRLARGAITPGAEGIALLAEAVDLFAGLPFRLIHARAEYELGAALRRTGDLSNARTHLRSAVDLSVRCDYLALGKQARDLLLAAGGRMRPLSGMRLDALTVSELHVAELAASGCTNQQIAEFLVVTVRAVEIHLTNIYRKLGVGNRTELSAAMQPRLPP